MLLFVEKPRPHIVPLYIHTFQLLFISFLFFLMYIYEETVLRAFFVYPSRMGGRSLGEEEFLSFLFLFFWGKGVGSFFPFDMQEKGRFAFIIA
jgi:hypothetical protein